jgi:hypothetical protein
VVDSGERADMPSEQGIIVVDRIAGLFECAFAMDHLIFRSNQRGKIACVSTQRFVDDRSVTANGAERRAWQMAPGGALALLRQGQTPRGLAARRFVTAVVSAEDQLVARALGLTPGETLRFGNWTSQARPSSTSNRSSR